MVLMDLLKGKKVILASKSPRRQELLSGLGIDFSIEAVPDTGEHFSVLTPHSDVPELLAKGKSYAFPHSLSENQILITADTLVFCPQSLDDKEEEVILGKPKDKEDAIFMLKMLSGKRHKVLTGVCLRTSAKVRSFTATSYVSFKELSDEEIDYYIETYHPYDKAGSYGVQEWIGYIAITSIEGSFYNVMGLPVQKLYEELGLFLEE